MAFIPNSIANNLRDEGAQVTGTGFIPGSIANAVKLDGGTEIQTGGTGFQAGSIAGPLRPRNSNLDTSTGLYDLAVKSGLKSQADQIMRQQSGEETKKIFSGGFISDTFDVLNAMQFGVVGMLKGKSFAEGVRTRQSFSDKDALGDNGIPGFVAGIALDILFDPLTYIAPATIIRKIPFATKALRGAKEIVFGKSVVKEVAATADSTARGLTRLYEDPEGGTQLGRYLARKLSYNTSMGDPVFRDTFERSAVATAVEVRAVTEMGKIIGDIVPETAAKILSLDKTGRPIRVPLKGLVGLLDQKELDAVTSLYSKIDRLGQEMVDLGMLGKKEFEDNFGEYLKSVFTEYELAQKTGIFGFGRVGFKPIKGRVEGLTPERMKELGQITNPAYLLFKTSVNMIEAIKNAKLFKEVRIRWATDEAQEGFAQIPNTTRFTTSQGIRADILGNVKKINTDLKPMFKDLRQTFKADKKILSEIDALEKEMGLSNNSIIEDFYKFFNEGGATKKITETSRKLGIIPEGLQPLANSMKKFKTFDEMIKSDVGIQLEKLDLNGDLQRNNFRSMQEFFDTVKNPYKPASTNVVTKAGKTADDFVVDVKDPKIKSDLVFGTGKGGKNIPLEDIRMKEIRPKPTKITIKELDLLKLKIQNLNKGFKAGAKTVTAEIKNAQSAVIKILKDNFDMKDRGKFLNNIKNATNPTKLSTAIDVLKSKFDDITTKTEDAGSQKILDRLVNAQKQVEKLLQKITTLKEIDKRSINDSFRMLEKNINDARFVKEDLLQTLKDAQLGDLAGKYVPQHIADYLQEIIIPAEKTIGKTLVASFKFAKVIMNPATHVRNIFSNRFLNWWKLDMNPLDPRVIAVEAESLKEIFQKGGKWSDMARPYGFDLNTGAVSEMKAILDSSEVSTWSKGNNLWQKTKTTLGNIYQAEENQAKLSAFIWTMKKGGISPEQAWKAAESATFNYAQVTPFVRKLRESLFGFPFITFTVKSTPIVIETALKNPGRISVIGKIKQAIESQSDIEQTDRERASEPPWVKDGFYIKLPIKDKEGRSSYFDLTYILPFGDIVSGNFFGRGINRESGTPESFAIAASKNSPFITLVSELAKNQDFFGNKLWLESDSSDKQLGDLMRHLTKTMAPPLVADQIPGGYNSQGVRQQKGFIGLLSPKEKADQQRTIMQELLRSVGAKIQPIDADIQETYQEWNKKKGMQTLLRENGIGNEANIFYLPKK